MVLTWQLALVYIYDSIVALNLTSKEAEEDYKEQSEDCGTNYLVRMKYWCIQVEWPVIPEDIGH